MDADSSGTQDSLDHSLSVGTVDEVLVAIALVLPAHLVEEDLRILPWSMDRVEQTLRTFILRADRKNLAKIIPTRDGDSLNQPALLVIEQLGRDAVMKGGVTAREHEGRVIFINHASLRWYLKKFGFTRAQKEMVWRRIKCFADAFKDLSFVERDPAWTGLLNVFLGEDAPPSLEDFLDEACLARPHVLGPTHATEEVAIVVGGTPRGARVAPRVPGAVEGRLAWTDRSPSR